MLAARFSMGGVVTVPVWVAIALGLLAAWAALEHLLLPLVRGLARRRVHRVLEELDTRLKIRIPPFKRTRREIVSERPLLEDDANSIARLL